MGRIGRSLTLFSQSYRVLMQDKELMVLPVMAGLCMAVVGASFFFGLGVTIGRIEQRDVSLLLPTFLLYVVLFSIGTFFQAAVIAGATERLRGGDPTLATALGAARRRLGAIIAWSIVAATVGVVLRLVRERAGVFGKLLVGVAGLAWSLAVFFVVPVLVFEDRTITESFKRSMTVFRSTWGETVVGSASIGVVMFAAWMTLVAIAGLLAWAGAGIVALIVFFAGAVVLAAGGNALQAVYVASLYEFATNGTVAPGFDRDVFSQAFQPRAR